MALIDITYFIGERHIANVSSPSVAENIIDMIAIYEPELLEALLGIDLYADLLEGLEQDPIEARWTDLVDGTVFIYRGQKVRWIGLRNAQKRSPLADFVYFKYKADNVEHTVGAGNMQSNAENGTIVSPMGKMVPAWNSMSASLNTLFCFIESRGLDYSSWTRPRSSFVKSLLNPVNSFNI